MATNPAPPRRLYLLQVSTGIATTPGGPLAMVLPCYVVETGDGKHILIDSGFPPDVPQPPGTPQIEGEKNVIAHLADLGLRPNDIDLVICTHFDIDHVGYHDAFTRAEFVVQREHYELARSGHPRFAAARAHWNHPSLRYRLVDGDRELLPGLTLLATSGHQSVLVRLPRTGPVLLAIDAVMFQRLFSPDRRASPSDQNEEQLRTSTRKLLDLVEREQIPLVVFGHDGLQWQTLEKAPKYYD